MLWSRKRTGIAYELIVSGGGKWIFFKRWCICVSVISLLGTKWRMIVNIPDDIWIDACHFLAGFLFSFILHSIQLGITFNWLSMLQTGIGRTFEIADWTAIVLIFLYPTKDSIYIGLFKSLTFFLIWLVRKILVSENHVLNTHKTNAGDIFTHLINSLRFSNWVIR